MPIDVVIATEDALSEEVLKKVLYATDRYSISLSLGRKGNGYLRDKIRHLNQSCVATPILMLTDQDNPNGCAPQKIVDWLGRDVAKHANFLFRVAVMEVEAWVLADREHVTNFLGVRLNRIPHVVDDIEDPKQFLVNLARASRNKNLREGIVPRTGSTAQVGPNYNPLLTEFVREEWDPNSARLHSPSLQRTINRLAEFTPIAAN